MTNGDNGARLAHEMVASVALEYGWPDFKPREHSIIKVEPKTLDQYTGDYQTPYFALSIKREGDRLFMQAVGEPTLELFPEGEHQFFSKTVAVKIIFQSDEQGRVTQLALRQEVGMDQIAKRLVK